MSWSGPGMQPSLGQRALALGIRAMGWLFEGYSAPFVAEMIRSYGVRGMFERGAALTELMKILEAELGERDAHLLIGYASLWNGCQICAIGHVYAASLAHFAECGTLFGIDERELQRRMLAESDHELLEYSERALRGPGDARILGLIRRLYAMKREEDPGLDEIPGDGDMIAAAIAGYDWLNHCTIYSEGEDPPVIAFSSRNRQWRLRRRYAVARAAERGHQG